MMWRALTLTIGFIPVTYYSYPEMSLHDLIVLPSQLVNFLFWHG
ncbi:hypothetical protein SAMN05216315_11333 [Nitrosospira sp. Nsp18]|nr:hypothetical protein SAMN05216315_11333 [Nitrosospira sp. Nsp18]